MSKLVTVPTVIVITMSWWKSGFQGKPSGQYLKSCKSLLYYSLKSWTKVLKLVLFASCIKLGTFTKKEKTPRCQMVPDTQGHVTGNEPPKHRHAAPQVSVDTGAGRGGLQLCVLQTQISFLGHSLLITMFQPETDF